MGILQWLQIIFIVLKILDAITWSWMQVLIPSFVWLGLVIIASALEVFSDRY